MVLAKSLRPLPEKFHGLTDTEMRYRQRYVDLIANPEVKDTFVKRSQILKEIRAYLDEKGFLEVDTPILTPFEIGASARPFYTHHNSLNMDMVLRIETELYLKRLIVGGMDRVYEVGRIFRNEGMDPKHNPEFTSIELYQAFTDFHGMMDLVEELYKRLAQKICGSMVIPYQGKQIDTISDFVWGRLIEDYRGKDCSRIFLLCSVVINLFILGFFKYADFLLQTVNTVFGTSIPLLGLPLPIGISFYTFQTMSYVIDVYRGDAKAQRNILQFGVYVTMFPQLIAGPILKYHQIEKYLQERRSDLDAISYGAKRFVTGLAKKVLLANNLGLLWTQISSLKNDQMSVLMAWIGIVAYAFQIYFDFSGYSDMAIGLGAILGFHFPENFNYPYIATSVTDFWHRWHISLSTWFKEYVYIPLGGNRKGLARQILNILIVWTLTGIWHGAGWNFLLWGLWFALFLILEKLFLGELLKNAPVVFGRVYTLTVVLISWVFFALEKPGEIPAYLQAMFGLNGVGLMNTQAMFLGNEYLVLLIIALVACLPVGSLLIHRLKSSKTGPAMALYRVGEKVIPAALLILSVAYIVDASYNPFLYFRF